MDLLDRQLDVELNAVEDVFEIGLLIHIKLQNRRHEGRVDRMERGFVECTHSLSAKDVDKNFDTAFRSVY